MSAFGYRDGLALLILKKTLEPTVLRITLRWDSRCTCILLLLYLAISSLCSSILSLASDDPELRLSEDDSKVN